MVNYDYSEAAKKQSPVGQAVWGELKGHGSGKKEKRMTSQEAVFGEFA